MRLNIHIDGGSRGNPGPAGVGVVIHNLDGGQPMHEAGYFLGRATNNVAEYQALLRALQLAAGLMAQEIRIHSDSELMVRQITGQYRVKSADLKPLYENAQMLLLRFNTWSIRHVPREQNSRADELANLAMDARRDVIQIARTTDRTAAPAPAPSPTPAPVAPAPKKRKPCPDCPRWTARFAQDAASPCPVPAAAGQEFSFGPATPAGLCIYAAEAILADGPLTWDNDEDSGQVHCPHCGAVIQIQRTKNDQ